jgi:ribosomal protein S27E
MKKSTYKMVARCDNCGHCMAEIKTAIDGTLYRDPILIPKGTPFKEFFLKIKCAYCGCKGYASPM